VNAVVEEFHARGRAAVLAGAEVYDRPPSDSSPRWGLSVILRPDRAAAERLAAVTAQLAEVVPGGHWLTGRLESSHLTVRGLEPYRDAVSPQEAVVQRYAAAVSRTAARVAPLTFALTGVLLMPGGVLVSADPVDAAPAELRTVLAAELGPDAGFEDESYRRGTWWSTLMHFAEPLADREALVAWVDAHREADLGLFHATTIELVRYEYNGVSTAPVALASAPLES
jgi:hypothetical protein